MSRAASPSSMRAASSRTGRRAGCSTKARSRACGSFCRPIRIATAFEGARCRNWRRAREPDPPSALRRSFVELRKAALMPDRIGRLDVARRVELRHLFGGQFPADGADVLEQLLFVARADDDVGDGRATQQPVESDLRNRLAGLLGDAIERVDDIEQALLVVARPGFRNGVRTGARRRGLPAPDFARQLAPAERAPDDRADALVASKLHQLPFVVAIEQRIIGLMRDIAGVAITVRHRERLHEMPAGEIRAADVADLAGANELIERRQRLLDRGVVILPVQLEKIDRLDAEALERTFDRHQKMLTRGAIVVRAVAHREGRLGGNEQAVTLALDRLAQDLFGEPGRIDVGSVEQAHAVIETYVDQSRRAGGVGWSPCLEEVVAAAECAGAEPQRRHAQAGMAETIVVHAQQLLFCDVARDPFAASMQTHLTAGGSTVTASANFRMSLVSSSISRLSQLLKTPRPIRSRAASRRSVIAFPFGEITAWRTRRSAALARRLTRPRLSSLATWRLTVV